MGSGITALISAYTFAQGGYRVTVLSKSPDPRSAPTPTRFESATWDGYINRYITLTEGHPYLPPGPALRDRLGLPQQGINFHDPITAGGALTLPWEAWNTPSRDFLHQRRQAADHPQATDQLWEEYLDENRASLALWYGLLTQALADNPDLYPALSLHSTGIDRLYDRPEDFRQAVTAHQRQGILKQVTPLGSPPPDARLQPYPWLSHPHPPGDRSHPQGGILTQYGLAFDVQALGRCWLLPQLERLGVRLGLGADYRVLGLERDDRGEIAGLTTANGQRHQARHYLLHPGAYGDPQLLAGTPAQGQLAGVKGIWLRLKNAGDRLGWPHPPRPCKIHYAPDPLHHHGHPYPAQVTDINAMAHCHGGTWDLICGSGYGFVGVYPGEGDGDPPQAPQDAQGRQQQRTAQTAEALMVQALVEVVQRVYGLDLDAQAILGGTDPQVDLPSRGCLRSWTPDDRELRTLLPTTTGGLLVIHGGGNTGSTTKAPFISQVALALAHHWDDQPPPWASLAATYEALRQRHRKTPQHLPPTQWQQLEDNLHRAIVAQGYPPPLNPVPAAPSA